MSKFEVGDKVVCVDATNIYPYDHLKCGVKYTVTAFEENMGYFHIRVEGSPYLWRCDRFELVERKQEQSKTVEEKVLTIKYGDVSIDLDPSNPFSRKFAEVFLTVVYGESNE